MRLMSLALSNALTNEHNGCPAMPSKPYLSMHLDYLL